MNNKMNKKVSFYKLTEEIYDDTRDTPIRNGVYYKFYYSALRILVQTLNFRQQQNYE